MSNIQRNTDLGARSAIQPSSPRRVFPVFGVFGRLVDGDSVGVEDGELVQDLVPAVDFGGRV